MREQAQRRVVNRQDAKNAKEIRFLFFTEKSSSAPLRSLSFSRYLTPGEYSSLGALGALAVNCLGPGLTGRRDSVDGNPGAGIEWRNNLRWNLSKPYPLAAASGRDLGASSKGARRNASRQGRQIPWVVTGRTAADSGPGSGPGSKTPHQAHTRIHTGEASDPGTIGSPSKINGSIGCL